MIPILYHLSATITIEIVAFNYLTRTKLNLRFTIMKSFIIYNCTAIWSMSMPYMQP